jgi:fatty-acid desaturase
MFSKTELSRIHLPSSDTNPREGLVKWAPKKSLWLLFHTAVAIVGGFLTFSPSALVVFLVTTAATLCLGHSLGMHRKLIHGSYACPKWLEYLFVHLGTLVGMAGPIGMMRTHDIRDWAQKQESCHAYLRHGSGFLKDAWWQLHCELELSKAPDFVLEERVSKSRMLNFMERTWMAQQLPLAIVLFLLGGLPWVIWGISVRVAISVTGHWFIGYFAHNSGEMDHEMSGAVVQGHNVRFASYLTMGESWHNNHHAFPGSAILGIYENQPDPGWVVLNALHNLGLVWNIVLPSDLPLRKNLRQLTDRSLERCNHKKPHPCPITGLGHS